jgi:pimeloyl-ACP methyl ester carboxylesterase
MANDAVAFITALGLKQVDLLGFSLGGFVAQVIAAEHPDLVRRVILAGTGPEGGEGIRNLPQVLEQAQKNSPNELRLFLFFEQTDTSQGAGRAFIKRQAQRTADRDPESSRRPSARRPRRSLPGGPMAIRARPGVCSGSTSRCSS